MGNWQLQRRSLVCWVLALCACLCWSCRQRALDGQLAKAVYRRDTVEVKRLLVEGADPNSKFGPSPVLLWAVDKGDLATAEALLTAGAEVNARPESNGWVPLQLAVAAGYADMVELLVAHGADVNLSLDGASILSVAIVGGHPKTVRFLVGKGAHLLDRDSLPDAVARSDLGRVGELLEAGMPPTSTADGGLTAFHCAVAAGELAIVQLLLSRGADARVTCDSGITPLHSAAAGGNEEMISFLLTLGLDVNAAGGWGTTPLMDAAIRGRAEVVETLVRAGASLHGGPGVLGATPLHLAAHRPGNAATVRALLAAGADPNEGDRDGHTPLHSAASAAAVDTARALLEGGAKALGSNIGVTPVHTAVSMTDSVEILDVLRDAGADVNARDVHAQTALHIAAFTGHNAQVEWLLQHGADVEARDNRGHTPADRAHELDQDDILELLEAARK